MIVFFKLKKNFSPVWGVKKQGKAEKLGISSIPPVLDFPPLERLNYEEITSPRQKKVT